VKVRDLLIKGLDLGRSEWITIDQRRIDLFAEATGDRQWIHVDTERAADGPFGGTIAHGYLVVSMLPVLLDQVLRLEDQTMGVNYGMNRVRFTSPVRSGDRIRVHCSVEEGVEKGDGVLATLHVVVEVDGSDSPSVVGDFLLLAYDENS
jgi:acyl dehydratase